MQPLEHQETELQARVDAWEHVALEVLRLARDELGPEVGRKFEEAASWLRLS